MRKLKFVFEKSRRFIIPTLAATMITASVGCSRNKNYDENTSEYNNKKIEVAVDTKEQDNILEEQDKDIAIETKKVEENLEEKVEENLEEKAELSARKIIINSEEDVKVALEYDNIEYLKIENANIEDFSFLKNINIKMLQIINNKYPIDMSNVKASEIEQIYLHNVKIENKEKMANFKKLYNYMMKSDKNNSDITNLNYLSNCKNLESIAIQNYAITDLEFAKNLENLTSISIYNSSISSLNGIENCSKLEQISIQRGMVKNIDALSRLENLQGIDLTDNNIDHLSNIKSKKLSYISLSDNFIQNVDVLSQNENLNVIDLSKNNIASLPSKLLKDNTSIDISYNNISSISEQDKSTLRENNVYINLFDNLLDSSTLKEISNYDSVYFETNGVELTSEQAINYSKEIKNILSTMGKNDNENIMRVSKYIIDNCKLDYTYADENKDNAYGALFTKAVCTGMTDLTNTLCRHQNIKAKVYHGDLENPDDYERHVWSICNGYHVDAMQSMANKDDKNYPKIVLLSDEQIKKYGHILDANNVQKCNSGKTDIERNNIVNDIENSRNKELDER